MKKDIAFLTLGQAGGNIGKLFESLRFKVLHVNTSQEDLNTLSDAKHVYHITGGEGAARDRNRAKELVTADILDLQYEITKTLTEEFIFVVFSAGGGTGSGSGPMMMAYLSEMFPERVICGITILPAARESIKAQYNAFECFTELEKLDAGCLFVIDNNGKPDKFALNDTFVSLFMSMLNMTGYTDKRGNIDVKELKDVLSAKGIIMVSMLPSGQSSTPRLIDSFKNGIFARPEEDRNVQYIALSMASEINTDAFMSVMGTPEDIFQGYNPDATICVLSGLSLPYTKLGEIKALVSEEQAAISKVRDVPKPSLLQNSIELKFTKKAEKPKALMSPNEVLSLFRRQQ